MLHTNFIKKYLKIINILNRAYHISLVLIWKRFAGIRLLMGIRSNSQKLFVDLGVNALVIPYFIDFNYQCGVDGQSIYFLFLD